MGGIEWTESAGKPILGVDVDGRSRTLTSGIIGVPNSKSASLLAVLTT